MLCVPLWRSFWCQLAAFRARTEIHCDLKGQKHCFANINTKSTQTRGHCIHTNTGGAWANSYWGEPCIRFPPGADHGHIVLRKVSDYVYHPNVHTTPGEWPQKSIDYLIVKLILAFSWENKPGQLQDTMVQITGYDYCLVFLILTFP